MKNVLLYVRVSTEDQEVENQLAPLKKAAKDNGWNIVGIYRDNISAVKKRPGFDALCQAIEDGKADVVAAWSVDRLGRSLETLIKFMTMLHKKGIDLYLHQSGIDTTKPAGKAMFQMMGIFAEFEREMIRERVRAGMARGKAQGAKYGKPPKWTPEQREQALALKAAGKSCRDIAKATGMGLGTVGRIVKAS